MFKILSWFIVLVLIFFIGYYLFKYGGEIFSNNESWFGKLNSGNQQMLQQMQNPNGMFVDNTTNTPSFLDKWFPGIFPLIKVGNAGQGIFETNNSNSFNFNKDSYDSEITNQLEINIKEDVNLNEVLREVNFGGR